MKYPYEAERRLGNQHLWLRGVATIIVAAIVVGVLIAKSNGDLDEHVEVKAMLAEVGDGLPTRSDVKYRGVLVGAVSDVIPAIDGGTNIVDIDLKPEHVAGIPSTVTARVVPGNVFAVSSIQLIDNGTAPHITDGAEIFQDDSEATIQFQTALTKLRDIVRAMSRSRSDSTIGVITALAEATDRRGDDLVTAGRQLEQIVTETNALMAPGDGPSTIRAFNEAVRGLDRSAPELLDAVHSSVVPMRTLAEKDMALTDFLSAGATTLDTTVTAMNNNTDRMITISTNLTPVIGVLADNAATFVPITTRLAVVADRFNEHVYDAETGLATSKMILSLSPNHTYVRADCPRYGRLEGASCKTAPVTAKPYGFPAALDPKKYRLPTGYEVPPGYKLPPGLMGGNVGPVGSKAELEALRKILGKDATPAAMMLLAPLLRGNKVDVRPDTGDADARRPGTGGPR
ncbi:MCE family protein [Gordonia jinghuaiqii]|uniref:MCE family protein n=1 Tax=Gordonia jinghuaiqii TaxID=2758710 RepID=A0A7D7LVP9_9ACTN|nr:MCE family protein [Gordonia jinghuaiqii]MCR5976605.1 MCE family protein [Gordonia jinghuaiqii]QMS99793.1 MCE family protein [Gordonia jinghuaiqii]